MKPRLGILGTGGIANLHMKQIRQYDRFDVVACCDLMGDRCESFCGQYGISRHYTDYRRMLENENLDALMVLTPNCAHMEPTIAALEAGVHVFCEKPMALTVGQAEAMVRAEKASKATLMIGQHWRFFNASQYIRRVVMAGDLGEIYYARIWHLRQMGVPWWGQFHRKDFSGGGALIDNGAHIIDLALWLMGSPQPVEVMGSTSSRVATRVDGERPNQNPAKAHEFDVEDFASGFVRMSNGATLSLVSSWAINLGPKINKGLEICGDMGGARFDPLQIFSARHGALVDVTPQMDEQAEPHGLATEHFRRVILGEEEPIISTEEPLNALRIIHAVYRSAAEGGAVALRPSRSSDDGARTPQESPSADSSPVAEPV